MMTPHASRQETLSLQQRLTWFLTVLLAVSPFAIFEPSPFDILTLGLLLAVTVLGLHLPRQISLPAVFAVLFLAANLLSFVEVSDYTKALRYVAISTYMFAIWLLFAALFYFSPSAMFRVFWKGYLFAALLSATIGILAFFHWLPDAEWFLKHGRARALFKDPNVYGPFLIPAILYSGLHGFSSVSRHRWIWLSILFVLLLGLLVGFSRAAWGNLIVATLMLVWLRLYLQRSVRQFIRYLINAGIVVGLASISLVVLLQIPAIESMMEKRAALVQSYDVGETGRFGTQYRALMLGLEKPLGTGAGEIRSEFARYPHNVYLLTWVENGWLGWLGFTGFLWLQIVMAARYLRSRVRGNIDNPVDEGIQIAFVVLFTIALQSLFIDSLHWRHMFMFLGVTLGSIAWMKRYVANQPAAVQ